MSELDADGLQLLKILARHIVKPDFDTNQAYNYLTYKVAHDLLHLPCQGVKSHDVGKCLQNHGLNSLAEWTKNTAKPGITGLIVNSTTLMPGKGYFHLFEKDEADAQWWLAEVDRAKKFDWSPFLENFGAATTIRPSPNTPTQIDSTAEPLPLRPTKKYPVRELVSQAGIDVSAWSFTKNGEEIENPNDNIGRNTKWSFVGVPPEPIALCVWFNHVEWNASAPALRASEYPFQKKLIEIAGTRKGNDGLSRLNGKLARSRALHLAIYEAHRDARPVRMILVDGAEVGIEEAADEASKVTARELDPATWFVHSFDGTTGEYAIVRGRIPPNTAEESEVQKDTLIEPELAAYLASLEDTERDAMVKVRVCQGAFRDALFDRWKGCAVTECCLKEVLIAGHIRPWSRCENVEQRRSPANGLLLSPNLDKLFDAGLISFDDNYRIVYSPKLPDGWAMTLGVNRNMRLRSCARPDILPYLQWHRENRLPK